MNQASPTIEENYGNTHAGRVRLKLSVSRPTGSLSDGVTLADCFGGDSQATTPPAPQATE
jgi:hypothetical protein